MTATNNIFRCPVCKAEFSKEQNSLVCENGHRFDISASGYVNLLPVQKKNSKVPGDSKEMVASRRNFLSKGYYEPLKDAVVKEISKIGKGVVFDCGCGEGYYTGGIAEVSEAAFGIDISKTAVEKAAKKYKNAFFAVASAYDLPVKSESVDTVCDIFAPLSAEEFRRILVPGGYFLYVVPAEKHLMKMKEILYETLRKRFFQGGIRRIYLYQKRKSLFSDRSLRKRRHHVPFHDDPVFMADAERGNKQTYAGRKTLRHGGVLHTHTEEENGEVRNETQSLRNRLRRNGRLARSARA